MRIVRAAAPHPRFLADEQEIPVDIAAAGESEVSLPVRVDHSGEDVENASLVLGVRTGAIDWWVLARLRIQMADGMPQPRTERIDVEQAG